MTIGLVHSPDLSPIRYERVRKREGERSSLRMRTERGKEMPVRDPDRVPAEAMPKARKVAARKRRTA